MKYIYGNSVLSECLERYHGRLCGHTVIVVRFSTETKSPTIYDLSSDISTSEKIDAFQKVGLKVVYQSFPRGLAVSSLDSFVAWINESESILGVLIQNPIPLVYRQAFSNLCLQKDIDAWLEDCDHPFALPATVDATIRLLAPFANTESVLAVIGSEGFIGRRVRAACRGLFSRIISIDIEDDLSRIGDANIIVSAVGVPGLISSSSLCNRLFLGIDIGFHVNAETLIPKGDIDDNAHKFFGFVTPVPKGIGPLSLAVLVERLAEAVVSGKVEKWSWGENGEFFLG